MLTFLRRDDPFGSHSVCVEQFEYRRGVCLRGYLGDMLYRRGSEFLTADSVPQDGDTIECVDRVYGDVFSGLFGGASTGGGGIATGGGGGGAAGGATVPVGANSPVPVGAAGGSTGVNLGGIALLAGVTIAETEIRRAEERKAKRRARRAALLEQTPTRSFDGVQNTVGSGVPVPLCWGGPIKAGGHIVSTFEERLMHVTPDSPSDPGSDASIVKLDLTNIPQVINSTLFTRVVICGGPIESIDSIEVDGNPVANLKGMTYETRNGGVRQLPLKQFNRTVATDPVQTTVTNAGGAQTFETTGVADSFEVGIEFNGGLFEEIGGALNQLNVNITLEYRVKDSGDPFTVYKTIDINFISRASWDVDIKFPDFNERAIYEIRVTRNTADPTGGQTSEFRVNQIRSILYGTRSHPGLAQLAFEFTPLSNTSALLPQTYTSVIKGFRDIRQYSDSTTFTTEWTNNPAWCCAHYLTDKQWGLGRYFDWTRINIPSFIRWANYNDDQVDDGRGNFDRRNTYAKVWDVRDTAQDILLSFARSSGVTLLYDGDQWTARVEEDAKVELNLDESMVHGRTLTQTFFEGVETLSKVNAVFQNNELDYVLDIIPHEVSTFDTDGELATADIDMIGVTRPSQAARLALRALNEARLEKRSITFEGGIETIFLKVGSRFKLASKTTSRVDNGRILFIDSDTQVVLDTDVVLESGKTYNLSVRHVVDGHSEMREVVTAPTTTNVVELRNGDWTRTLKAGAHWYLVEVGSDVEEWRVTQIDLRDDLTRRVTAVNWDDGIFDTSGALSPETGSVDRLPNPLKMPTAPTDMVLNERLVQDSAGDTRRIIDVDWKSPVDSSLGGFDVYWRESLAGTIWQLVGQTSATRFMITENVSSGKTYQVAVVSVSRAGSKLSIDDSPKDSITTS